MKTIGFEFASGNKSSAPALRVHITVWCIGTIKERKKKKGLRRSLQSCFLAEMLGFQSDGRSFRFFLCLFFNSVCTEWIKKKKKKKQHVKKKIHLLWVSASINIIGVWMSELKTTLLKEFVIRNAAFQPSLFIRGSQNFPPRNFYAVCNHCHLVCAPYIFTSPQPRRNGTCLNFNNKSQDEIFLLLLYFPFFSYTSPGGRGDATAW